MLNKLVRQSKKIVKSDIKFGLQKSEYKVEQRKVSRTGFASIGWIMGLGYTKEKFCVEIKVWCVIKESKVIAECRSKAFAQDVARSLNTTAYFNHK